jgi:GDP-L-fucose synthase
MDISLAKEMLGYEHNTSLLEGLQKTWDWYINHPTEYITRKNYFTEADNV